MTIDELNALPPDELREVLYTCCASVTWVEHLATLVPFNSPDHLINMGERCWHKCREGDWMDALSGHPRLGDLDSLAEKFKNTSDMATEEQSGTQEASEQVLEELALANEEYEKEFGFRFILFATNKTAETMLSALKDRLKNDLETEKIMAMVEQNKITRLRLEKLLS
jgi:2-oxo-4-hydroxy-4-carboxy-5-ureidoimidazoline decarboxylase